MLSTCRRTVMQTLLQQQYWLDEQHIESDGLSTSYPPDLQELTAIHSELSPPERQLLLDMAKALQQVFQSIRISIPDIPI